MSYKRYPSNRDS